MEYTGLHTLLAWNTISWLDGFRQACGTKLTQTHAYYPRLTSIISDVKSSKVTEKLVVYTVLFQEFYTGHTSS